MKLLCFAILLNSVIDSALIDARITGFINVKDNDFTINRVTDFSIELQYDQPDSLKVGDQIYMEFSSDFQAYFAQFGSTSAQVDISDKC